MVDDERIWTFEQSLWLGDAETYRELIDDDCVMVLPTPPFVMSGREAIEAVVATPKWSTVEFGEQTVSRPEEGLIVIGYVAEASGGEGPKAYRAYCTSTLRRLAHDEWRVVQHQQTPALSTSS